MIVSRLFRVAGSGVEDPAPLVVAITSVLEPVSGLSNVPSGHAKCWQTSLRGIRKGAMRGEKPYIWYSHIASWFSVDTDVAECTDILEIEPED